MPTAIRPRPPLRVLLAIGLVAGCTLALQVLLTRIFASALLYHFAFLTISLALLGVGAGAILVYVRPSWFARGIELEIARWCVALAFALVLAPAVLVRLHYPILNYVTSSFVLTLGVAAVLCLVPFLAGGIAIALAIRAYVGSVGRVYAFDLGGAGLGAVLAVPLMWVVPVPRLLVALALAAALAGLLAAWSAGRGLRLAGLACAVAVAATAVAATTSFYDLPFLGRQSLSVNGVKLPGPVADRWTPISRVLGYAPNPFGGGVLNSPPGREAALMLYDRDGAPVPQYYRGEPYLAWQALELGPQSIAYALGPPGDALVIGGGGGRDIFNALSAGERRVDVIELNSAIRRVVDRDLRRWSGSPYTLPGVHSVIGDGRSTLAARARKYDNIQINYTNTQTASTGGAFALAENNLYTIEAFQEYFRHLRPGGVLAVSRLYAFSGLEALRATVLTLDALRSLGVKDPERNVAVVLGFTGRGLFSGTVLAKREPFTASQLALIRRLAAQRGGVPGRPTGLAYAPGGPYQFEWGLLARARSPDAFCASYATNVCAPTDDQPFFFAATRLTHLGQARLGFGWRPDPYVVLLMSVGVLAVLSLLAFALPLLLAPRAVQRPTAGSLLFFAFIGVGYLVLEICLIQRFVLFLGFPTYSLSVVLFALLTFTGLGALLTERMRRSRPALLAGLGAVVAMVVAAAFGLQPLLRALIYLPFGVRVAVSVALLAPVGVGLGMAMPLGLRRLAGLQPAGVPWAWGINGIFSVLASALAVTVAISTGFEVTTLVAGACYAAALAHAALGRWPAREPETISAGEREPVPEPAPA